MTDTEPQKPDVPPKAWLLPRFCLYLGLTVFVLAVAMNVGFYINYDILPVEAIGPHPIIGCIAYIFLYGMFITPIVVVFNLLALIAALFKKPRLRNFITVLAGLLLAYVASLIYFPSFERVRSSHVRDYISNLEFVRFAIEDYAKKNFGQLPTTTNWCDDLAASDPNFAYCLKARNPEVLEYVTNCGMNKNIVGKTLKDLPADTVLLFETEPAKNPAGGPELMNTKNHNGKGCFVMFANKQIKFVRPEDFNNLRWKP